VAELEPDILIQSHCFHWC